MINCAARALVMYCCYMNKATDTSFHDTINVDMANEVFLRPTLPNTPAAKKAKSPEYSLGASGELVDRYTQINTRNIKNRR